MSTPVASALLALLCVSVACGAVGDDFTIGVYYAMPSIATTDNFDTDYGFMDMARHGVNFVVRIGNAWSNHWAALKHWDIQGITSYNRLGSYPGPGNWDPADFVSEIESEAEFYDTMYYNDEYVGDTCIGYVFQDEVECHNPPLTEDEKNFLRAWADVYHQYNPTREIYLNHCDPPWLDLHQKQDMCSTGATIVVNGHRITERIAAAQSLGHDSYNLVSLPGDLAGWIAPNCGNVDYFGFGPCSQQVQDWMTTRSNYQDVYEYMIAAYSFGAKGFTVFLYNYSTGYAVALVDPNGVDVDDRWPGYVAGRWAGFGDAAHDIRRSHGWPGVKLFNNGTPFEDRGNYPAGQFTLTAEATSDSGTIEKVIFGKSTNGGSSWDGIEDTTVPYSGSFSATAGETVIFRARAVDTVGKKSIYAANMIYIN